MLLTFHSSDFMLKQEKMNRTNLNYLKGIIFTGIMKNAAPSPNPKHFHGKEF